MYSDKLEEMLDSSFVKETIIDEEESVEYTIIRRDDLGSREYTRRYVYKIKTVEDNHSTAKRVILNYLNVNNLESKAIHDLHYKQNPSIIMALKPYFEFTYDEEKDCFWYTEVYPYDD